MKARVTIEMLMVSIDLDYALDDSEPGRKALRDFLSFVATALTCESIAGVNLQNSKYQDFIDGDAPVPVPKPHDLSLSLGRFPIGA